MKKVLFSFLLVVILASAAFAHDPRTVAKDFSHTFALEGAGKLTLSYKSLHFNEVNFNNRKTPRAMTAFNSLWKVIGK